jgi:hypothetical protein
MKEHGAVINARMALNTWGRIHRQRRKTPSLRVPSDAQLPESTMSMLLVARNMGTPLKHPSFLLNRAQIMSPNLLKGWISRSA